MVLINRSKEGKFENVQLKIHNYENEIQKNLKSHHSRNFLHGILIQCKGEFGESVD